MSDFTIVGSSLFEESIIKFLNEQVKSKKVNEINTLILKVEKHEFNLGGKIPEIDLHEKELLVAKCELEEKIEIPLKQILSSSVGDYFGVVSTGELFKNICQFLRSDDRISNYKDELRIIFISGLYFSKHLSLLIKFLPKKVDSKQPIQLELFGQVYEDILSLITRIPNNIVKEAEVNKLCDLDFKQITQKDLEKRSKCVKILNCSSNLCDIKSNTYQSTRNPYQFKDMIFKINSLTLSSSSHDAIGLFIENQLTCVKITIASNVIDVVPIRQKFRDITSILIVPSFYLFNMQNNHNLLINWSPDQYCTRINRVIYTSLLSLIIQLLGAMGIQVSNAITLKSKVEINDYFDN